MKSFKSFVPNAISFLNLNSGVLAVITALDGRLELSVGFVLLGIFFDFFDGLAARALDVKSELGVQLDSFADLITSGLAPGLLLMQLMVLATFGASSSLSLFEAVVEQPLILIGLFVPMGSAFRLGVFNIDDSQSDSFVGLPTPANAILLSSLVLIESYQAEGFLAPLIHNSYLLMLIAVLSAFLLNAPVRLFSFKFASLSFKDNKLKILFIVLTLIFLLVFKWSGVPIMILSYLLLGNWKSSKK